MNQFYNRINNSRLPQTDQLHQSYKSILKQGFPANQLSDASQLPLKAPLVVDFMIFELTETHINSDNFSYTLKQLEYPFYQRFEGRELGDQMWPELLDVIIYLLSILDYDIQPREYTDEFAKLAAMREDFILQQFQVQDDPKALAAVQRAYQDKCQMYLDKVKQDIDLVTQDLETLQQEYAKKASEPALREKIKETAKVVERDMQMLQEYMVNADAKFSEVESNLNSKTEQLEAAQDTLAELETQRRKYDSLLDNSGLGLTDLLSDSNSVKVLQGDLQDAQQKLQNQRSTHESLRVQFAKSALPIQQQLRSLNHTFGVELPTKLNPGDLPQPETFSDLDHKIQLETRNLSLEHLRLKTEIKTAQTELDADHREILNRKDTKERLGVRVSTKSNELQQLMSDPQHQHSHQFAQREQSKNTLKQKRDELLALQSETSRALREQEKHIQRLEEQISCVVKPLYESVGQKRSQLAEVYAGLQASVSSLQNYTNEYMDVCDEMRTKVGKIPTPEMPEYHMNADFLIQRIDLASQSSSEQQMSP